MVSLLESDVLLPSLFDVHAPTCSAGARSIRGDVGISCVEGVASDACGLSCSHSCETFAPALVFPVSDWFQMRRVYALPDSAQVVELHGDGDFSDKEFISHPMSQQIPRASVNQAVPISELPCRPQPTGISLVDATPESLGRRSQFSATNAHQPTVVLFTQPPSARWGRTILRKAGCSHG